MKPYWSDDLVTLHLGDCLDVLPSLPDASVDAVITDPPYGLAELSAAVVLQAIAAWMGGDRAHVPDGRGFMGSDWDRFVPPPGAWDECMRVLKPGGHLLAFAGSRTVDLMTLSIRIAGFEIRDGMAWLYGQGYPKSLDVSKAIDKGARGGMVRAKLLHFAEVRGINGRWLERRGIASAASFTDWTTGGHVPSDRNWEIVKVALEVTDEEEAAFEREVIGRGRAKGTRSTIGPVGVSAGDWDLTAAATEDAARWEGWGTALKPAHEPIVMARKPLAGTVARNVLEYGTGAINVAACKVGTEARTNNAGGTSSLQRVSRVEQGYRPNVTASEGQPSEVAGRWPPNVLLDPFAAEEVDRQSGVVRSSGTYAKGSRFIGDKEGAASIPLDGLTSPQYADSGGASRFFPVFRYEAKAAASERPRDDDGTAHSTVKPVDLMAWLVRLVTPPSVSVLTCIDCGHEQSSSVPRVRRDVPAKTGTASTVLAGMSPEGGREGTEAPADAVPNLRESAGGRPGEDLLQYRVPGDCAAQAQSVHHLPEGVPGTPAYAEDVLTGVRGSGHDAAPETVRGVRGAVPAGVEQGALLFPAVLGEGDRPGQAQALPDYRQGLPDAVPAGSPDVESAGLRAGAPQGDGRPPRPDADGGRGSASPQRDQGRQPAGEPRGSGEAGPRPDSEAATQADCLPALRGEDRRLGTCTHCGGALARSERPGIVLDPFAGSGTTAEACIVEGFRCILVEREERYARLIRKRLSKPIQPVMFGFDEAG